MRRFSLFARRAFVAAAAVLSDPVFAQAIPPDTAIPIVLTRTIATSHAKPGDLVAAKTLQAVLLPGGRVLPAGTALTGHIVTTTPFHFDTTPFATQTPSTLSIHFDSLIEQGAPIPVMLSVRAVAGPVASHEAETPHGFDETDWSATRTLIGGDTTSPLDKTVVAPDGSTAGYNRPEGIYARLLASVSAADPAVTCNANPTEQSVSLFSADACGVYGLNSIALVNNGSNNDGNFILESRQRNIQLDAGTTAILEVVTR